MDKKTKIIATISDLRCDVESLQALHKAGMDVVRANTAHQEPKSTLKIVRNTRKVSDKIPIMIDTKGPEVRTDDEINKIPVKKGDKIIIVSDKKLKKQPNHISTNYKGFVKDVPVNTIILINDGEIELEVVKKESKKLTCIVNNDGILKKKKTVNVPGVELKVPSLSQKDLDYIDFCIKHDVEFIAHSFVRNKEDVLSIQKKLDKAKSKIKIIAKIENKEGVDNLDEILDHVYGVMIARGDLAIEIKAEKLPAIQKRITKKCIEKRKVVITATQMLHTMIENPRPTRAEVSDVANAVFEESDAIMLSGETTEGKYPVESVRMMKKIAKEAELNKHSYNKSALDNIENNKKAFLARTAIKATINLDTNGIVSDTLSGKTARLLSALRGDNNIYAMCYDKRTVKELAMSYGVYAYYMKKRKTTDEFLNNALTILTDEKALRQNDEIVILAGSFGPDHGTSFVEIGQVKKLKK